MRVWLAGRSAAKGRRAPECAPYLQREGAVLEVPQGDEFQVIGQFHLVQVKVFHPSELQLQGWPLISAKEQPRVYMRFLR